MFSIQAASLGWSAFTLNAPNLTVPILNMVFALYVVAIAVRSVNRDNTNGHYKCVVHLAILLFFTSLLLGTLAIMPSASISTKEVSILQALWYAAFGLYLVAFFVVINIPRGPALYFPPSQIYSEKTAATVTDTAVQEENVCGIVNASIWQLLFFSYTTKVRAIFYDSFLSKTLNAV